MKMSRSVQRTYEAYLCASGHTPEDARKLTLQRWEEIEAKAAGFRNAGCTPGEAHFKAIDQWEKERDRKRRRK